MFDRDDYLKLLMQFLLFGIVLNLPATIVFLLFDFEEYLFDRHVAIHLALSVPFFTMVVLSPFLFKRKRRF